MSDPFKLIRIPTLKTVDEFRRHLNSLGLELPCDDQVLTAPESPLCHPHDELVINQKRAGNRIAIHPMEGWDGTPGGGATEEVRRRWRRFGESGAKLIFGGEAMAVVPDGRANPNQLVIVEENKKDLAEIRELLVHSHHERHGTTDDLLIGFQLTHSGRFCRPREKSRFEPKVAYRHPILDRKFGVTSDAQVWTDGEIEELIEHYVRAAKVAAEVGADFIDLKHCHGYLLHEFLSAVSRPGKYGGSFENRTRILREMVEAIRSSGNRISIAVRLSAFDSVPFRPDPNLSKPGKLGPGVPEDFQTPYHHAFGARPDNPLEQDLTEPMEFVRLCHRLGIQLMNLTAGSPYYNPHLQRPAAYPPSDGYQPAHDPLIDVVRQIQTVRWIKQNAPSGMAFVGTAYSYLQEYLALVAQALVRDGWVDFVGLGRMTLSYPEILSDPLAGRPVNPKLICRTFSDCTTAPRNGMVSGCYPLDKYYSARPEFQKLKEIKRGL